MVVRIANWAQVTPAEAATPVRADGRPYRFEMLFNGLAERAYADTASELLDVLIPGYADLGEPEQQAARLKLAVRAQVLVQAEVNHDADLSAVTAEEHVVLLGHRNTPPEVHEWSSAVPLVLVDVFYAPIGALPRPVSGVADVAEPPNLWWISPADPHDLLVSLHRAGFLRLNEHRDYQAA